MELITTSQKLATEYGEKVFGDKDPELRTIVEMEMALDPEDPDDMEKKNRVLAKLAREHKKDYELLNEQIWNIHNENGELIPHIFRDGRFIKYEGNVNDRREPTDTNIIDN